MRVMKQKLILFLLIFTMPFCVLAAELGDDGLHKQSWIRDTFKDLREDLDEANSCLLYTSPSPRDRTRSRMPSSA